MEPTSSFSTDLNKLKKLLRLATHQLEQLENTLDQIQNFEVKTKL